MARLLTALLISACSASLVGPAHAQSDPLGDDDELRAVPVLRLAVGPSVNVYPDPRPQLAFESTVGVSALQGIVGGIALNAETGYAFDSGGEAGSFHGGTVTLGAGYGNIAFALLYRPRFLIGTYNETLAFGMRNGVGLHLAADLGSVELGHQFLQVNESLTRDSKELRHDVVLLFAVNPLAFVYLVTEVQDAVN